MNLSKDFYKKIKTIVQKRVRNEKYKIIIKNIDWNKEADRCYRSLISFFKKLNFEQFENNKVGVVDIRWNEYGGDIEIDFMPDNDLEIAFDEGCIMNNSAVDNDLFFIEYFDCSGEDSFEKIDEDYFDLTFIFYNIFLEILPVLVEDINFKNLPKKDPYYITFSFSHEDEEPNVIFTTKKNIS